METFLTITLFIGLMVLLGTPFAVVEVLHTHTPWRRAYLHSLPYAFVLLWVIGGLFNIIESQPH